MSTANSPPPSLGAVSQVLLFPSLSRGNTFYKALRMDKMAYTILWREGKGDAYMDIKGIARKPQQSAWSLPLWEELGAPL